jgi:tRNA(adenine34) deaminase
MKTKARKEFMMKAIEYAKESAKNGDYALCALVVKGDRIIAKGTTNLKHEHDPTIHGEIVAIRNACKKLKSGYLKGCVLYTTLEPCPMCTSAAIWAKMQGIVFGAFEKDAKNRSTKKFSWRQIKIPCKTVLSKGMPKLDLKEGFMRKECLKLFELSS